MTFADRLRHAIASIDSNLCVGLDPLPDRLPAHLGGGVEAVLAFNRAIIDATIDLAPVYKPNLAFYEALGADGWRILGETIRHIGHRALVIADAKRGDIDSTAEAYAVALFDRLDADACTVNPYLGWDSVRPFAARRDRGTFVVCRTSNPSATDFQDLVEDDARLYVHVARRVRSWNVDGNLGLVAGATRPEDITSVREAAPGLPILVPGVGTQGGDLAGAVLAAGDSPFVINSSRSIMYASPGRDFAEAARAAARDLRDRIARCRVASVV